MHSQALLVAACAFFSAAAAGPTPRDLDTVTEIDYVTEIVTSTVWVDADDPRANQTPAPAPVASVSAVQNDVASDHGSHSHGAQHTHDAQSYAAAPSSTSVYVAPTLPPAPVAPAAVSSSTSVYVPPPVPTTFSSAYVAPSPAAPESSSTTSQAPPPTTSTAAPTTAAAQGNAPEAAPWSAPAATPVSSAPAAASSPSSGSSSSSGSGQHYTGIRMTFYGPDGGYGSCGWPIQDTDMAVAISVQTMDKATMCGKTITIKGQNGKADTVATIADTCMACPPNGLDLTSYNTVTGQSTGVWNASISSSQDTGAIENGEWWWN